MRSTPAAPYPQTSAPESLNHELFFADSSIFHMLVALCSSPHSASATIRGVVQSLGGVGEQSVAIFLQVDEVAVGAVDTAR